MYLKSFWVMLGMSPSWDERKRSSRRGHLKTARLLIEQIHNATCGPELGGPRTPIAALRVDERLASPQMIDPATMTKVIRARFRSAAEELIIRDFVRSDDVAIP
jgi:hypothetical protein